MKKKLRMKSPLSQSKSEPHTPRAAPQSFRERLSEACCSWHLSDSSCRQLHLSRPVVGKHCFQTSANYIKQHSLSPSQDIALRFVARRATMENQRCDLSLGKRPRKTCALVFFGCKENTVKRTRQ